MKVSHRTQKRQILDNCLSQVSSFSLSSFFLLFYRVLFLGSFQRSRKKCRLFVIIEDSRTRARYCLHIQIVGACWPIIMPVFWESCKYHALGGQLRRWIAIRRCYVVSFYFSHVCARIWQVRGKRVMQENAWIMNCYKWNYDHRDNRQIFFFFIGGNLSQETETHGERDSRIYLYHYIKFSRQMQVNINTYLVT